MLDLKVLSNHNPVLLFDSSCGLCTKSVQFILKRKNFRKFRFVSIEDAQEIWNLDVETGSLTLLYKGRQLTRSSALFQLCSTLGMPWSLFGIFWIIPKSIRDAVYDFIARNRYKWFGKKDMCYLPAEDVNDLFIKA